ncbi:trypsin-like serine protease [Flavobacterium sp. ACN6]|uniref:trypsin-like serine protease n=1 Tax=Flavobacterium sp. ACN6 TaxID=1920426 RepID=UPI000BB340E7|nr:trypsin-like serine protease [Flavobacterium sp. ACN6]PBJ07972.1 Trypsin [Flavobacterium sp. ACN6]
MKKHLVSIILFYFFMPYSKAQIENSVFAVVKISYNIPGETPVIGGICGTGFLIKDSTVLIAHHVLNTNNFKPNPGYRFVQFWLLKRGTKMIIPLSVDYLESIPEIEAVVIKLPVTVKSNVLLSETNAKQNDSVKNYGHLLTMPITTAHWDTYSLIIDDYNLETSKSDASGHIVEIQNMSDNANDIKLTDIKVIKPSFKGNIGMSGGPLICNDKVIGMMSFGLPADQEIKEAVFAIAIDQIIAKLK